MELHEDPDEGFPFPRMRTVRLIGHPNDAEAWDFHPPGMQGWAHTHQLPESAPFDLKQRIGAHIDRWHYPTQKEGDDAA